MVDILIRFLVGGLIVSLFSLICTMLRPRTFAGLFGAAPSIALATVGLTFMSHPARYIALEGRSMVVGAIAFACYAGFTAWLLMRRPPHVILFAAGSLAIWFAVAFGLWAGVLQ